MKAVLGWLAFRSGIYKRYFRNRALVVLFHRVDDRYGGTPISVTRAVFHEYLDFFRRYFVVISLAELMGRLQRNDDLSGQLVITFDDGYLDNQRDAAVALAARRLPACFFIATEFIGSTRVPWWDAELGIQSEWMSWDQVRDLRDQGFELGAHTMNHVDLGKVSGDEARGEISGSKARLEREIERPVPFFTFPYGRPNCITEPNREEIRRAGCQCCLSAYGGSVRLGDDLFELKRTPVSGWHLSPYHFGFEAMREPS